MNEAVRDCLVSGYEPLIEGLKLPDPGDRHVLAAAVKGRFSGYRRQQSEAFPTRRSPAVGIEAKSPDDFVLDLVGIDGRAVAACIQHITDSRTRPPQDIEDVLGQFERDA